MIFRKKNKKIIPWKESKSEDFKFDLIEYYFRNKDHSGMLQVIDDRIMEDIHFDELFLFIDRTHSRIGQQYFYDRLLSICSEMNFEKQEKRIAHFVENEEIWIEVQSLLSKLDTENHYHISNLFIDEYIPKPKWFWGIKVLSFIAFVLLVLALLLNKVLFIPLLLVCLMNTLIHFWNKNNIMAYMDSVPQLPVICKITSKILRMDTIFESKNPVLRSVKSIDELKNKIRFFKLDTGIQSDIESLLFFFWEIVKILFLVEPLAVFDVLKKLAVRKADIQTVFEYLGEIDSAISIATIRMEMPYFCKPEIANTANSLEFTDIFHPLIPGCISNSLQIRDKSILLTGSNMSGKTTFVWTVFINLLLGQTINTCFSKHFKLSKTRLFSSIRIFDNMLDGKSYYFEEVLSIKKMIEESCSGSNNLFFLDEIFKGTNTVERIAAGKAVLSYLVKSRNNLVFVSTHDIELADLLTETYELYHFTEVVQDGQIYFDYKLKQGNLSTKNAIRILEINSYPGTVIDEARKISDLLREMYE